MSAAEKQLASPQTLSQTPLVAAKPHGSTQFTVLDAAAAATAARGEC